MNTIIQDFLAASAAMLEYLANETNNASPEVYQKASKAVAEGCTPVLSVSFGDEGSIALTVQDDYTFVREVCRIPVRLQPQATN